MEVENLHKYNEFKSISKKYNYGVEYIQDKKKLQLKLAVESSCNCSKSVRDKLCLSASTKYGRYLTGFVVKGNLVVFVFVFGDVVAKGKQEAFGVLWCHD